MRLELKDIPDAGLHQDYFCSVANMPLVAELEQQDGQIFTGDLGFRLRLQKTGQLVAVDGAFTAMVALICSRCLQKKEQQVSADFSLTFTPQKEVIASEEDEELELDSDELGLVYYRDDTLDLTQALQEQVLMALPIAPVCKDGCSGLCPVCGCDLNLESCTCEKKPFNNKFTGLSGLKLDSSE